jgi:hypothetical protein
LGKLWQGTPKKKRKHDKAGIKHKKDKKAKKRRCSSSSSSSMASSEYSNTSSSSTKKKKKRKASAKDEKLKKSGRNDHERPHGARRGDKPLASARLPIARSPRALVSSKKPTAPSGLATEAADDPRTRDGEDAKGYENIDADEWKNIFGQFITELFDEDKAKNWAHMDIDSEESFQNSCESVADSTTRDNIDRVLAAQSLRTTGNKVQKIERLARYAAGLV